MATHKTPGSVGRTSPKPKLEPSEDRALEAKRLEVLSKLGLRDPEALPGSAKDMLVGVLEGNRGRLELVDAEDLARRLRDQSAETFAERFRPSFDKPERLPLPGNLDLTKEKKDGRFQVQGSLQGKDHPVNLLMKELEINPSAFGPEVRKVIDGARGADLGHSATWNGFVRDLAVASVKDKPLASLGAEDGIRNAAGATPSSGTLGLGLEKTAKAMDQKESRLEDSPELLMNSEKIRNPEQEGRRQDAVFRLQGALADAGLSKEQLEDFGPVLDKVLRQGQLRGSPTEKAWAIVGNIAQAQHGKPLPKGEVKDDPLGLKVTSLVAAAQLLDLAESKFGTKLDSSRTDGVARILEDFVGAKSVSSGPASKSKINLGSGAAAKKAALGPGAKGASVAVKEAHDHARRMGLDPDGPQSKHTIKDMETAFSKVLGDGKKSDREVIGAGLAWLEANTKGAESSLKAHVENILGQPPKSAEIEGELRRVVLGKVALCAAAGPDAYVEHLRRSGAAGAVGPGGGVPFGGAGGFRGVPGVSDQYGVTNPIMRQAMGAAILYDPALSHEDRIMLLLMLITQHMDQDRLRKMDELAVLDRKEAQKAGQEPPKGPPGPEGPTPPGGHGPEGAAPPPPPQDGGPGQPGPEKARDVLMFELDRIGKMRDQVFTALQEIIKKKDESVRGVLQSMQR